MSRSHAQLSRRERQIMDVIYARREVSAAQVLAELPDPPSYSAVRAMLRILEEKGLARHRREGRRYLYVATVSHKHATRAALRNLLDTFFEGSIEKAVAALLGPDGTRLADVDYDRLARLVEEARKEGR